MIVWCVLVNFVALYEEIRKYKNSFQMLEASLYISEHLPDGASGLWAVVNCATWVALGELEWIPFAVLRKSIDINLLGTATHTHTHTKMRG